MATRRVRRDSRKLTDDEHKTSLILDEGVCSDTRTTLLIGEVDGDMLSLVHKSLLLFQGQDCRFILNSGGGEVVAGLAICDLFEKYRGDITVDIYGEAESMAAVILQAADIRRISKSSHLMLHEGEDSPPEGLKKNIKEYLKLTDKLDDACDEIVIRRIQKKHPKYSWTQFRKETSLDVYFDADKALHWGLVDVIL